MVTLKDCSETLESESIQVEGHYGPLMVEFREKKFCPKMIMIITFLRSIFLNLLKLEYDV